MGDFVLRRRAMCLRTLRAGFEKRSDVFVVKNHELGSRVLGPHNAYPREQT